MRNFLWAQEGSTKGKAKVAWKSVCTAKFEGGLGIRRISDMNKALITSHAWSILTNRNSLWVKWVHAYKLKGKSVWEIPASSCMSWGWRKLLRLRPTIRKHIWPVIGNGASTSMWTDKWSPICPLRDHISPREIKRAGFSLSDKVADLIENGAWKWPVAWLDLFPVLINCATPTICNDQEDNISLCKEDGSPMEYSTSNVWELLRTKSDNVNWVNLVWFSKCIPRHAFLLWLVMKRKLKTHDRLKPWDMGSATNLKLVCCSLCKTGPDSHIHLFFQCAYTAQVWTLMKPLACMGNVSNDLDDITSYLIPISKGNSAKSIIGRLSFAATVYFIWQERNNRMFSNKTRPPDQLKELIVETVRHRLASIKFKKHSSTMFLLNDWKLPKNLLMDGDDPSLIK